MEEIFYLLNGVISVVVVVIDYQLPNALIPLLSVLAAIMTFMMLQCLAVSHAITNYYHYDAHCSIGIGLDFLHSIRTAFLYCKMGGFGKYFRDAHISQFFNKTLNMYMYVFHRQQQNLG